MKTIDVETLIQEMQDAYACLPVETQRQRYDAFQAKHGATQVQFSAPVGEWMGNLAGFAAGLKMRGQLPESELIQARDKFNAQGLEGKISIVCLLPDALLKAVQCDPHRWQIEST